ncbi:hypothetical protein ACFVU0_34455 [Streptomyces sp. NPDC058122]|uniref:hypothetical protein n=1 Tax=Streptomyces sp. NPDC058122 TaxID=3346349 RepID=UPI0036EB4870
MSDLMPLLASADLSGLADREGTWFATGRGRVLLRRYTIYLEQFTYRLAAEWLTYRHRRWRASTNGHLLGQPEDHARPRPASHQQRHASRGAAQKHPRPHLLSAPLTVDTEAFSTVKKRAAQTLLTRYSRKLTIPSHHILALDDLYFPLY